jgi:LPXTG-site transpeptidase (sortase) family protein
MKKVILVAASCAIGILLGITLLKNEHRPAVFASTEQNAPAAPAFTAATAETPTGFPLMQQPARIEIPSLGIISTVQPVGREANNEMELPDSLAESGWYKLGAAPGNPGKAVIAAHTGYPQQPSQFRNLSKLKPKDTFTVIDHAGNAAHFEVMNLAEYRPEDAPLASIFGDSPTPRLALITCAGEWHAKTQSYSHRLVIFAVRYK